MNINEKILGQIYMSQNYDAQPLETEKKIDNPETSGSKPEGAKPLEDRTIFQIDDTKCDLVSDNFRIGLYNFVKEQGGLKDELATIRQRLNLTEKGDARSDPNKKIDTRSVINEVFAQSSNVRAKVDAVLAGVVNFSEDVKKEICDAIWRQRDNPDIRRFLQSGGNAYDLAAICKLTLDSMKERGFADFAHRMVMSYLKGFTLGMSDSPIRFDKEFEKSFEEDQLFREERTGIEDRRLVELQGLKTSAEEAVRKLENDTKDLLPASDKKDLSAGEQYLQKKYAETRDELLRYCSSRKEKLEKADDADDLKKLSGENFKDELTQKVNEWVNKMKEFQALAQKLDQLAKFTPDYGKVCGEAPADSKEKANYDRARSNFEADYKQATTSAEGDMLKCLNELKGNDVSDESLKKIWTAHYQNATQQIENEEPKEKKVENVGGEGESKNEKIDEKKKKNDEIDKNTKNNLDDWYIVDREKLVEENPNVNKQNNENPKEYSKENKLAKFVSKGVFKEKFIRGIRSGENQESYNEKVNEMFRKEIFPNWPSLRRRLEDLRKETMSALGIDSKLESWFMKENPLFDMDSPNFLDDVRWMRDEFSGKNVKSVEDKILSRCRLKDTVPFNPKDGGPAVNYTIIVGNHPDDDKEDKHIYLDNVKNYGAYYERLGELSTKLGGKYEMGIYASQIQGLLDKRDQIETLNNLWGEFVSKVGDKLDNMVKDTVKSLCDGFTEKERNEISDLICEAVTKPIIEAKEKNIWDITPTAFMSNFVRLCVDRRVKSADDVKNVVQGIIDTQLDAHFVLKKSDPKGNCLIVNNKMMIQNDGVTPNKLIVSAIKNSSGLIQVGGNNCFMVSIVNALLGNEKGQKILENCFCNSDGKYHFKDQKGETMELTADEVGVWVGKHEKLENMSKLEQTIWAAWLKAQFETPEKYDLKTLGKNAPGEQCEASDVAFLFGLGEVKDEKEDRDGVSIPESKLGKWVNVKNHLASGNIAIVHQGVVRSGHYEAVTGAESENDVKFFTCCDSLNKEKSFGFGELQSEKEKNNTKLRRIIRLTLPEDVA